MKKLNLKVYLQSSDDSCTSTFNRCFPTCKLFFSIKRTDTIHVTFCIFLLKFLVVKILQIKNPEILNIFQYTYWICTIQFIRKENNPFHYTWEPNHLVMNQNRSRTNIFFLFKIRNMVLLFFKSLISPKQLSH